MNEQTPSDDQSTADITAEQTTTEDTASTQETIPTSAEQSTQEASPTSAEQSTEQAANETNTATQSGDIWGADWRVNYAGGDEKLLKRLERYSSPKAALDAMIAAQNKIASGLPKSDLPENPTPEEVTAWRAENGIPEKASDYEISLNNGMVIGEEDKPMIDSFLESAHAGNMRPEEVNRNIQWYMDMKEQAAEQQLDADEHFRQETEDLLRKEWGQDYRRNVNIANNFLDQAPAGLKDRILGARLADGKLFGDDPQALSWLTQMAREINPVATIVPNAGQNALQTIDAELNGLRELMGDRTSKYWKGPEAQKLQARYRELVDVRQKAS